MEGRSYGISSRLQAAGLKAAIQLFEQAAAAVPLPSPPRPIVIADYGASTGHNSLLPIRAAIAVLRTRTRPEHSILVGHTDLPDNDFGLVKKGYMPSYEEIGGDYAAVLESIGETRKAAIFRRRMAKALRKA